MALLAQTLSHFIAKLLHHPQGHLLFLLHLISLTFFWQHLAALLGLSGPHFLLLLRLVVLQGGQKRSVVVLGQFIRIRVIGVVLNLRHLLLLLSLLTLDLGGNGSGDSYLLGREHVVQF